MCSAKKLPLPSCKMLPKSPLPSCKDPSVQVLNALRPNESKRCPCVICRCGLQGIFQRNVSAQIVLPNPALPMPTCHRTCRVSSIYKSERLHGNRGFKERSSKHRLLKRGLLAVRGTLSCVQSGSEILLNRWGIYKLRGHKQVFKTHNNSSMQSKQHDFRQHRLTNKQVLLLRRQIKGFNNKRDFKT